MFFAKLSQLSPVCIEYVEKDSQQILLAVFGSLF